MAAFPGIASCRISNDMRFSRLLLPWVQKGYSVRLFIQSPHPVQYMPKHAKEDKDNRPSVPMTNLGENVSIYHVGSLTSNMYLSLDAKCTKGVQCLNEKDDNDLFESSEILSDGEAVNKRNLQCNRVKVLETRDGADQDLEFFNSSFMEESESDIRDSRKNLCGKIPEPNLTSINEAKKDAEAVAIEALATRAFSVFELQKKLGGKKFPPTVIETLIVELQGKGLLNDYSYAESFSRSRWQSLSWGPRRIKQVLLRKGVNEANVDKAMKQVFEGGDDRQLPCLGMSENSFNRLFDQAKKQWARGKDVPVETRKSRLVRWLQYRGFSWAVTNIILRKLEAPSA